MGVREEYRSLGIARALLSRLIEWATSNSIIEKINLNVLGNNVKAIALYNSLGFVKEGRKHKEIRFEDGTFLDDVLMGLTLNKQRSG